MRAMPDDDVMRLQEAMNFDGTVQVSPVVLPNKKHK
jgi:hypothetical protein